MDSQATVPSNIAKPNQSDFWELMMNMGAQSQGRIVEQFALEATEELSAANRLDPSPSMQNQPAQGQKTLLGEIMNWLSAPVSGNSATNATAATSTMAQTGSAALSRLNAITSAAYGVYDLVKNFGKITTEHGITSGLIAGASIGSFFPGGVLIGGLIGGAVGGIVSLFKNSGKPKDQKERDLFRKGLQQAGIIDSNFTIGLADGSRYDIGIDGKAKPEFGGRRPFEIDNKDPLAMQTFKSFMQVTIQLSGGNKTVASSFAGYFTNASLSNGGGDINKVKENVQAILLQLVGQR